MFKYSTKNILEESGEQVSLEEFNFGNKALLGLSKIAEIGGPFIRISPWKVKDDKNGDLIFAGGYGAMPFGIDHPDITNFIAEFLNKNNDLSFTQHSLSKWRAALSANLVKALSSVDSSHKDSRVFYSNSGAEAVETAVKFAKFYRKEAKYIINFTRSYHGKTFAALSLTPNPDYQNYFKPLMPNVVTLEYDSPEIFKAEVDKLKPENIIAVIFEPIQGDAGVIKPSKEFLTVMDEVCKKNDIILIADEVLTGLGRCGAWFSSIENGRMSPDIITLAKPLSGGIIPVGATIVREDIFNEMLSGINAKIHSNTFGGGALAMGIALKSLEIIEEGALVMRSKKLGEIASLRLGKLAKDFPELIESVNIEGLLWGIHFKEIPAVYTKDLKGLSSNQLVGLAGMISLHKYGVMTVSSLGLSAHIRLMPALNMPDDIFEDLLIRIERFVKNTEKSHNLVMHNTQILQNISKVI
jgi:acetylornithine/succinyldiaminopimelate/putrescine aminotransferase